MRKALLDALLTSQTFSSQQQSVVPSTFFLSLSSPKFFQILLLRTDILKRYNL
jgi:hypothetical protein